MLASTAVLTDHQSQPLHAAGSSKPLAAYALPVHNILTQGLGAGFSLDNGSLQLATPNISTQGDSAKAPPNSDRMILRAEFDRIQRLVGHEFTWDAACNDSGDNSLCRNYSCPARSFLDTDISGQRVWINPPFSMIRQFIQHYKQCKQRAPASTSACLVLPKWSGDWVAELAGMQLVKEYPIGSVLFSAPTADGSRRVMGGIPWPVQIWYDPPAAKADMELRVSSLTHTYLAACYGHRARVLIDTGASHIFVSQDYATKVGVRVAPASATTVSLADGKDTAVLGQCHLRLKVGGLLMTVSALVLPALPEGIDLILGDAWQKQYSATLNSAKATCTIRRGMHVVTLTAVSRSMSDAEQAIHYCIKTLTAPLEPTAKIITAKQFTKALARGEQAYVVWVKPEWVPTGRKTPPAPPASDPLPSTFMCAPKATRAGSAVVGTKPQSLVPESAIEALQAEFSDVFAPPTQPGPDLGIGHSIILPPGTAPIYQRPYRMSPMEREHLKRHIADLLDKGYIRPSSSPYGSPVLIVPKPNNPSETRLVVNYSKINQLCQKLRFPLPTCTELIDRLAGKKIFSTLDLASGFFQIRIRPEDIPKTAFTTPDGHYEFLVLPQGLSNSPATFQSVMSKVFAPYLNKFVFVYLDDIGVASDTPEQHIEHLRLVLQTLREHGFHARADKAQWAKPEIKFLGHLVGSDGVRMDPSKVESVRTWPTPRNPSELRSFLGLANYFRRFIQGYSTMVARLNDLLHKDAKWSWSRLHDAAFENAKTAITTAPVLALPDFEKPFEIITDASIVGTGGVLMQEGRPVAFRSAKLTPPERNYTTGEQELLAVYQALTEWRCYVEGAVGLTLVTDHNPLIYLQTQQTLSRRQARWMEFMSRFNYTWQYRPGRINVADPLSRCPTFHDTAGNGNTPATPPPPPPLLAALRQTTAASRAADSKKRKRTQTHSVTSEQVGEELSTSLVPTLLDAIAKDDWFKEAKHTRKLRLDTATGLWYRKAVAGPDQVVVPNSTALKQHIMRECHDAPLAGHPGYERTLEAVQRTFWWPAITRDVREYVRTCELCQRNKPSNRAPPGLLQPLSVPAGKWQSVSIDFIVALPKTPGGFDAVAVFVDRLTKMVHLAPCTSNVTAADTARLFLQHVVRLHGVPDETVTDRGPQFNSNFWKALTGLLGTKHKMSSAYHPQTDGQTERMNQTLECMLRHYINPTQTNWDDLLPLAEFAMNNAHNSSVDNTPFFLNYGMHPRSPVTRALLADAAKKAPAAPAAQDFAADMHKALAAARSAMDAAQQRMKTQYDKKHREITFSPGEQVLLSTSNLQRSLRQKQATKVATKLLPRYIGPFPVEALVGKAAVRLTLPPQYRFHNVFHVSQVKHYAVSGRTQPPPPPVDWDDDNQPLWRVEAIVGHKPEGATRKQVEKSGRYLVKWLGYGPEHNTWEPNKNFSDQVAQDMYWQYLQQSQNR